MTFVNFSVLIESDWNLKNGIEIALVYRTGINRIRLEFKGDDHFPIHSSYERVLIESDWNLKEIVFGTIGFSNRGINRIRLEFKG